MTDDGFTAQINKTLQFEGGYVWDDDDPGGETNFGISKASYPSLNIKSLTRSDAIAIYKRDFWDKPRLALLPPSIGAKTFDLGVNMGQRTAIKLLQMAINDAVPFDVVAVDGIVGPQTQAAAIQVDEQVLLDHLRAQATRRYYAIVAAHPAMRKYLKGWLRRASA